MILPPPPDRLLTTVAAAIRSATSRPVPSAHPVLAVAARMASQHQRQWAAETLCRAADADDGAVAAAKRRIDQLNAQRVACVDQVDTWCERHLPPWTPECPVHTETVGSVIDRIVIAAVRADQLAAELGAGSGPAVAADVQCHELVDAYGSLLAELAVGRRRVPSWRSLKHYRAGVR